MVQATTYGNPSSGEEFDEVATTLSDSGPGEDDGWSDRPGSERIARALSISAGPLPASATLEDYQKALYDAQLALGTLRSDARRVKLEGAVLPAPAGSRRRSKHDRHETLGRESVSVGPSSSISTSSESTISELNVALSQSDKVISMLGKRFGVMNDTFVTVASFLKACPPATSAADRFQDTQGAEEGVIVELYAAVPPEYHRMMRTAPHFYQMFLKALATNHRTTIHQLRNETATIIFGQNASYYKINYDRSAVPEFTELLRFPQDRDKVGYSKFMPILFPSQKKDLSKLFRSYPLAMMLKSILFGPSSLGTGKYSGPKPQGIVWGINSVTPGSIAFVAVLAIFLHSADSTFATTGAKSKIPYQKYFTQYKRIIIEGKGTPKIAALYEFFNGILFGVTSASTNKVNTNLEDEDSSGIEDALNDLRMSDAEDVLLTDPTINTTLPPIITIQPQASGGPNAALLATDAMEQIIGNANGNPLDPVLSPLVPATLTTIPETSQTVSIVRSTDPTVEKANQAPRSRKKGKEKAANLPTESSEPSTQSRATRRSTRKVT